LTELIGFREKVRKHFLLDNLRTYQKKKAMVSNRFFEANLEKNILTPDNKSFSAKKKERKKKNFCKAILPVLTASQ